MWWESFKKTSFIGQRKSWCRSESEFRPSHAMLYNHNFHFKYTEKLSNQFKLSFILFNWKIQYLKIRYEKIIQYICYTTNKGNQPSSNYSRMEAKYWCCRVWNNMAKTNIPSDKKKINRQADHDHWPASIKSTFQWFPFHDIMEYTGNIMQYDTHLTSSILKIFQCLKYSWVEETMICTLCL